MARPGIAIALSEDERSQLQSMSRSRSLPHSLVRRARIVVLAADGATNAHIAQQCWRQHADRDALEEAFCPVRPGGTASPSS
jgi:ribosomal protein L1